VALDAPCPFGKLASPQVGLQHVTLTLLNCGAGPRHHPMLDNTVRTAVAPAVPVNERCESSYGTGWAP
jgi:hypothetical protein